LKALPEESDQEAGQEVADGIDSGESAKGHAVLLFGDKFAEREFQALLPCRHKCGKEKIAATAKAIVSGAKKNRGESARA